MPASAMVAIVVVGAVVVVVLLFKLAWRVAEPNEALIISGFHTNAPDGVGESLGFRIVTGKGTLVVPGIQTVRRLSLDLRENELQIECVTTQGIPLRLKGVVIFKVGDDFASIANAARRFLDQQDQMDQRVRNVFAGHLRAIVGGLNVEDMIRDREKLTAGVRAAAGTDMEKLGLVIDSLQIQEIDDPTGYIANLAQPHTVQVEKSARIARAQNDREATQAEQEAGALKAQAIRDSQIKQAGFQAEVDQAAAKAKQAGPLSDAASRQEVVVQETRVAELEGAREEQRLQATVRKPADAKAYEQRTLADAQRDARISAAQAKARETELAAEADAKQTRLAAEAHAHATKQTGLADADSTRARGVASADAAKAQGLAEAASIQARADALATNQDAVISQQLAERWPEVVEAAAKAFSGIDNLTVLNGADGVADAFAKVFTLGGTGFQMAKQMFGSGQPAATPEEGATHKDDGQQSVRPYTPPEGSPR